ncbi:MAG: deoxycytidylate deaminase [Bacilli bacterium]
MPGKREEYLSWDETFMGVALLIAGRSKDPSTIVGACIEKNHKILSLGYNGLTKGMNDDDFYWNSIGEKTKEEKKIKDNFVIHAERNAILNYPGILQDLEGSTLYVTLFPCKECTKSIIQIGIKRVVWLRMYGKQDNVEISKMMFEAAGVEVCEFKKGASFTKEEVQETTNNMQKILKRYSPQINNPN